MFRPRWKKVISDLWDNKLRTILVVLSIAVGVFAVGMIAGAYKIIQTDLAVSYSRANPANITTWTTDIDDEVVTSISKLSEVKEVEGRRSFFILARKAGQEWVNLDVLASSDWDTSAINLLQPVSREVHPGERQLVLDEKALEELDISPGDTLEIMLQDGTIKTMPVVGIVQDLTSSAGDFLASPMGYVSFESLEWLRQPETYNRLLVTVKGDNNDEDHIRQVSNAVNNKLEKAGVIIPRTRLSQTSKHPMASTLNAVLGILGALGIMTVFLSTFLIANTLNALLAQHQRFIGVMKLIGARSRQIILMYLTLILLFSLIALAIAIPLSRQAAYALSDFTAQMLNFNLQGNRLIPLAVGLQVFIALAAPLIAGLIPVIRGSRTSVQQAISGVDPAKSMARKGPLDRGLERIRFLSRPVLISLRNTFRRKGRLLLTLITLTMGGAIFIAVFNVQAGLENYIGDITRYFLADVTLNFTTPYRVSEIQQQAMQIPGVKRVEGWAFASANALYPDGTAADTIQVMAPPAESPLVQPMLVEGRWLQAGDEKAIALSESVLNSFPDLKAGDTIRLDINGREDDWTVVGLFKFADVDNLLGYANYEYISKEMDLPKQAFSFRIDAGCQDEACQRQVASMVDHYFRDAGYHVNEAEAGQVTLKTASESLDILVAFLLIMALLTAVVGSIGLAGTMGMNVLERTREIGVMRSIGAVDVQIIKSVVFEGLFIGLISWILAVVVSFPFTGILSTIVSLALFSTPIDLAFTYQGFAIWLGLVSLMATLASALPARSAAKLTIREVLAYE